MGRQILTVCYLTTDYIMAIAKFTFMLLVASSQLMFSTASVVTFSKSPDVIKPILTKELSLKCSLEDSPAGGGPVVGKRDGVAETSTNINHLVTLVVQQNGVDIASITPYSPATALGNQGGLNVTGQITDSTGYLLLHWDYPGESESGNLTCEANGIDAAGHTSTFSTSLVLGVQEPSLTDLVNHVHMQEVMLVKQAEENKNLLNTVAHQSSLNSDLNKQVSQLSSVVANQSQEMTVQAADIALLKTCSCNNKTQGQGQLVQSGVVDCGSWRRWTSATFITKTVAFSTAYTDTTPVVHLSTFNVQQEAANQVLSYWLEVQSVTKTGFTMKCRVPSSSSTYRLADLQASWVSYPQ